MLIYIPDFKVKHFEVQSTQFRTFEDCSGKSKSVTLIIGNTLHQGIQHIAHMIVM
jgi:hypothetical protein